MTFSSQNTSDMGADSSDNMADPQKQPDPVSVPSPEPPQVPVINPGEDEPPDPTETPPPSQN